MKIILITYMNLSLLITINLCSLFVSQLRCSLLHYVLSLIALIIQVPLSTLIDILSTHYLNN